VRDGSDVWFVFQGEIPTGLVNFGRAGQWGGKPAVMVRGEKGDRMPLLAAEDFCRDNGMEPSREWERKW
jgi:hypothetical protein